MSKKSEIAAIMKPVICWWSGGATSAVACKLAVELFGVNNCKIIMLDTKAEHKDTYRFKSDCEKWYGLPIEILSAIPDQYESLEDVWKRHNSLNTANGAICSTKLKRSVREKWQRENEYKYQVFGFEFETKEFKRALALSLNHSTAKPVYPLLMFGYDKRKCLEVIQENNIEPPVVYRLGFMNNNCLGGKYACVQGGIGYYQKLKKEYPDKFNFLAGIEHELTDAKGKPVTMLKDQSKESEALAVKLNLGRRYAPLFLKAHPDYPEIQTIDIKKGRPVEPLMECNGFCGVNDLNKISETQFELNLGE